MKFLKNGQVRTPLSWYGGKSLMLDFVLPHLPPHTRYCEVFGGSGAVLFAKPKVEHEIYNDIDPGLVNLFRVIQNERDADNLCVKLHLTPNSRHEYKYCRDQYPVADPVECARQFTVLTRLSFASGFASSWGYSIQTKGNNLVVAAERIPDATRRLKGVVIENLNFQSLIAKYDAEDQLFYLDPPYLPETRVAKSVYTHELSRQDHVELLDLLKGLKGMAVLSGYPSTLYKEALHDWGAVSRQVVCHASGRTRFSLHKVTPKRTEMLWINPLAQDHLLSQGRLSAIADNDRIIGEVA